MSVGFALARSTDEFGRGGGAWMRNFVSFIPIFTSTLIKLDLLIKN